MNPQHEIYMLTVNIPQPTRIQCGCYNEMAQSLLLHAAFTQTFHSFRKVNLGKLPKRSKAELRRGEAFIKDALAAW